MLLDSALTWLILSDDTTLQYHLQLLCGISSAFHRGFAGGVFIHCAHTAGHRLESLQVVTARSRVGAGSPAEVLALLRGWSDRTSSRRASRYH